MSSKNTVVVATVVNSSEMQALIDTLNAACVSDKAMLTQGAKWDTYTWKSDNSCVCVKRTVKGKIVAQRWMGTRLTGVKVAYNS